MDEGDFPSITLIILVTAVCIGVVICICAAIKDSCKNCCNNNNANQAQPARESSLIPG